VRDAACPLRTRGGGGGGRGPVEPEHRERVAVAQRVAQRRGAHVPDVVVRQVEVREGEEIGQHRGQAPEPLRADPARAEVQVLDARQWLQRRTDQRRAVRMDPRVCEIELREAWQHLQLLTQLLDEREVQAGPCRSDQREAARRDCRCAPLPFPPRQRTGARCAAGPVVRERHLPRLRAGATARCAGTGEPAMRGLGALDVPVRVVAVHPERV
jgi:hypothetical protein